MSKQKDERERKKLSSAEQRVRTSNSLMDIRVCALGLMAGMCAPSSRAEKPRMLLLPRRSVESMRPGTAGMAVPPPPAPVVDARGDIAPAAAAEPAAGSWAAKR